MFPRYFPNTHTHPHPPQPSDVVELVRTQTEFLSTNSEEWEDRIKALKQLQVCAPVSLSPCV